MLNNVFFCASDIFISANASASHLMIAWWWWIPFSIHICIVWQCALSRQQFHHISHTLLSHVICNSFIRFGLRKLVCISRISFSLWRSLSISRALLSRFRFNSNTMHAVVTCIVSSYYFYPFLENYWNDGDLEPWWIFVCFFFIRTNISAHAVKQFIAKRWKKKNSHTNWTTNYKTHSINSCVCHEHEHQWWHRMLPFHLN